MAWKKQENQFEAKTEFNASVASLERLNELLIDSNESSKLAYIASSNKQKIFFLQRWKRNTMAIYRELSPKLKDKEVDFYEKLFRKIDSLPALIKIKKTPQGNVKELDTEAFKRTWQVVSMLEIKLRKAADIRGMLLTEKSGIFEE